MANKFHNKMPKGKGPPTGRKGGRIPAVKLKTAAWPGLPGPPQPQDRSGGTKKIKQSMRSEGI